MGRLATLFLSAILCQILCFTPLFSKEPQNAVALKQDASMFSRGERSDSQESLYKVSEIVLQYQYDHPEPISISELNQVAFSLCVGKGAIYGNPALFDDSCKIVDLSINDINTLSPANLSSSAIRTILNGLQNRFDRQSVHMAVIYIPEEEISSDGLDDRDYGDDRLTLLISVPTIGNVNVRDAEDGSRTVENPKLKQKIYNHFPSSGSSSEIPGDFIDSNALNQYLNAINRHPNRRVDLEIRASDFPGQANLNIIVSQKTPYHAYFNANNNVPKPINRWQESVGFIHTQLTNNDDILKVDASTDSFDKYYSCDASYEAPIGDSIANRWGISGSYSRFSAAEFALPQNLFIGTQALFDLKFISNIGQWDRLFLDLVADLQYRHIHNSGHFFFKSATKNFLLPEIALKAVQLTRENKLIASVSLQSTISSLFWDVKEGLDNLGRIDCSPNWAIVQAGFYGSSYLEPLFQKRDGVKHLAHEVVFIAQMQNAFNQRLILELESVLGGLYSIRGYPQSTIAGDNMYMGSLEYRFHIPGVLDPRPNGCTKLFNQKFRWAPAVAKGEVDWDCFIRAFYDIGGVTVNQKLPLEKNYLIMGTGLGVELILWSNVYIRGEWGRALKSANGISSGNNQFYYSSTIIY